MRLFKQIKNERGFTLLEVLASLVILTIILISVMNFFPQMAMMNKQNEEKLESINFTKKMLHKWQDKPEVIGLLESETSIDPETISGFVKEEDRYYIFEDTEDDYYVEVLVDKTSDLDNGDTKVHQLIINFYDSEEQARKITTTYGYISYM